MCEPNCQDLESKQLQDIDPAFYEMGYARQLRAYGIEFKEGDDGVGVYAAKDILTVKKPRVSYRILSWNWQFEVVLKKLSACVKRIIMFMLQQPWYLTKTVSVVPFHAQNNDRDMACSKEHT